MASSRNPESGAALPTAARVVVVGGGVIGCSVAYHLVKAGCRDVLLLERHKLTAGTTWHAAGLVVTSGFTTETSIELARYTRDLYARLEQETGVGIFENVEGTGLFVDLRQVGLELGEGAVAFVRLRPAEHTQHLLVVNVEDRVGVGHRRVEHHIRQPA